MSKDEIVKVKVKMWQWVLKVQDEDYLVSSYFYKDEDDFSESHEIGEGDIPVGKAEWTMIEVEE